MIPAALGEVEILFRSTEFAIVCKKKPQVFSSENWRERLFKASRTRVRSADRFYECDSTLNSFIKISEGENIGRGFNNVCNVKSC